MDDKTPLKTDLDEALEEARRDRTRANYFYDSFLNTDLFVPVQVQDASTGTWKEIGPSDRFYPLFLVYQEKKVIPIFDDMGRMKTWAQDKPLDYLKVRAHLFLKLVAAEVGLVLNLGTDYDFYFSGELLEQLRNAMRPVHTT